jgi:hypothetical protein
MCVVYESPNKSARTWRGKQSQSGGEPDSKGRSSAFRRVWTLCQTENDRRLGRVREVVSEGGPEMLIQRLREKNDEATTPSASQ